MTQVSIIAVRALLAGLELRGVERHTILSAAGLSAAQLEDANLRLSRDDYGRVICAALATTGDPALGLHLAEQMNTSRFDFLGPLAEHSTTLRDALLACVRYARIVHDGPRLELVEAADHATIRIHALSGESSGVRLTAEFAVRSLLHLIRRFVAADVLPRRVFFAYVAPPHRAEYTRVFGGRERFSHDFTGIELDRAWLDCAQLSRSPELHALLQTRAEYLLAKLEQDAPAAERVRRWLAARELQTVPAMDAIARDLGMSARSLRRRLAREGVPYSQLVEDARAERAKRVLSDPQRSVQETAYALGFSTPAAFTRAFKRWTGQSPTAFRAAR